MDQYHQGYNVYTDSHAAGNHFAFRGKLGDVSGQESTPLMNESSAENPHSGLNCIEAVSDTRGKSWGGWCFMNGVLKGHEKEPSRNWGEHPVAGIDLRGANTLSFWARGVNGGEWVDFFALGVGRDPRSGGVIEPYPGSSPRVGTGYVRLSSEWRRYTIDLSGRDLSYVLGGFGWVASAEANNNRTITFYIDDVVYDKQRLNEPRFLVSYQAIGSDQKFDLVLRNVAFTYDNAVALLAFLASGEYRRARLLADALVYAQRTDRYYRDGRIRNAYQGGDLSLPPGWTPGGWIGVVRMPGWCDPDSAGWREDRYQVSTHTGPVAWAILALTSAYEAFRDSMYLEAAISLGEWVDRNCRGTGEEGGYTGGFEGWEYDQDTLPYKATEHNIDLYPAFQRLHLITGEDKWRDRAAHARRFVAAMWDDTEGKFWTGTKEDGETVNKEVVPVDVQAWAVLALRDQASTYSRALAYADAHHRVGNGYDFNAEDLDGIWWEGTAQMAVAHFCYGNRDKYQSIIEAFRGAVLPSGAIPASDRDSLTTGLETTEGEPWLYFRRAHVGATAWMVLAELGVNPFWEIPQSDSTRLGGVKPGQRKDDRPMFKPYDIAGVTAQPIHHRFPFRSYWAIYRAALGYRKNAFFINDYESYYLGGTGLDFGVTLSAGKGFRLNTHASAIARRDLGDDIWNRVDWYNNYGVGLGADLAWDITYLNAVRSRSWIGDANLRAFASGIRLRFRSDVLTPSEIRPKHDFLYGGSLWFNFLCNEPEPSVEGLRAWLGSAWRCHAGFGFRYSETNMYQLDYRGFYLLEGDLWLSKDIVWIGDEAKGAGPAYWTFFTRDLGDQHWNKTDWTNHFTHGIGGVLYWNPVVRARSYNKLLKSIRLQLDTGYYRRSYAKSVEYVPAYRPSSDVMVRMSMEIAVGSAGY